MPKPPRETDAEKLERLILESRQAARDLNAERRMFHQQFLEDMKMMDARKAEMAKRSRELEAAHEAVAHNIQLLAADAQELMLQATRAVSSRTPWANTSRTLRGSRST